MALAKWCRTAYPTEDEISPGNLVVIMTVNTAVAISNILVNTFLIYALKTTGQLNTLSNKLIVCLSISDTGVGLFGQTFYLASIVFMYHGNISCTAELFTQAFSFACCHFSGVMLAIISIDRYMHIKHSRKYSSLMTGRRATVLIFINLVIALAVSSTSVVASIKRTFHIFDFIMSTVDAFVVFFIWCNYILILKSIKKQMKSILKRKTSERQGLSPKVRADAVLAKTILLIITAQIISYFPYFISSITWSYMYQNKKEKYRDIVALIVFWSIIFVCSNSTLNAVIWIYRNPKIKRRFMVQIFPRNRSETT